MNNLTHEFLSTIMGAAVGYKRELEQKLTTTLHNEDLARFSVYEAYLTDFASAIVKCTNGDTCFTMGEISQMIHALDHAEEARRISRVEYLQAKTALSSLTPVK